MSVALGDSILARLSVELALNSAAFVTGAKRAGKQADTLGNRMKALGDSVATMGGKLSVRLTAPLVAFGVLAVKAAAESADALGQVDAALKSMGDGAGRTSKQLQGLATGLMRQSLFDDDEILRKVTANLLTFGNVAGEQFDRAQLAAVNLSARLGTDLQASTILVGKALNDPVKGLAALARVGIQFTAQQKEQIKAMVEVGNAAGAQKIILAELERQFSGAAAAARKADPGAALKMSFNDFQETVGEKILPLLPRIAEAITKVLDAFGKLSPGMQEAVIIGVALAAALGPVLIAVGALIPIIGAAIPAFVAVGGAIATLSSIIIAGAIPAIASLVVALAPILIPLALVAAAIGAVYLAWKNWDKIVAIVDNLVAKIEPLIGGRLASILKVILNPIEAVRKAFARLYDAVVGNSYIPDMVDGIAAHMARLDDVMVKTATAATDKTKAVFQKLRDDLRPILAELFPQAAAINEYERKAKVIADSVKAGLLSGDEGEELRRRASAASLGFDPTDTPGTIYDDIEPLIPAIDKIDEALGALKRKAQVTTVAVAKSFKDMADATLASLSRLSSAIKGGGFLGILEAVIGLGLQLGSVGAFGKKIADRINAPKVPGYAGGTMSAARGLALVGERGPELVRFRGGERVFPNGRGGGGGSIAQIVPSPYFNVVVDGRVMSAAPAIMAGGSQVAQSRLAYRQSRRVA